MVESLIASGPYMGQIDFKNKGLAWMGATICPE
jgi:hypothetical protein